MTKEIFLQSENLIINKVDNYLNLDRKLSIMNELKNETQTKIAVTVEGPPVYLYPPKLKIFQSVQWDSMSFKNGWDFVNNFIQKVPEKKIFQYVLIDDLNYIPNRTENFEIQKQILKLKSSSSEILNSALFQPKSNKSKIILESEIAKEFETTQCSKLDAIFNSRKILDQVGLDGNPLLYAGNTERLMNIVVNPDTFEIRTEQLNMMMELYKILRSSKEFQKYAKKWSANAITQTFRHVWLNDKGDIRGVSRPIFHGSHFTFSNL